MKLLKLIVIAGLATAAFGMSMMAEAQPYPDRGHHGWNRGHHRGWHGHRGGWGRHCRTIWRHHHRVRVCR